jgi:hypothetical protein
MVIGVRGAKEQASRRAFLPVISPEQGRNREEKTFQAVFGQFVGDILLYNQFIEGHSPCYAITGRPVGDNREACWNYQGAALADQGGLIQQQREIGFYAVLHHRKY